MQRIKIDFITNTIIVSRSFYEAAKEFGSEECQQMTNAKAAYPNMTIAIQSGKRTKNENKGLTYKYMRRFISIMDEENLSIFNRQQLYYESLYSSNAEVYHHVKDWFLATYPHHKEMVVEAAPQRESQNVRNIA